MVSMLSKFILAFVTLIVGIALLTSVATTTNDRTSLDGYTDNGILSNVVNNGTGMNASYVLSLTEIGETTVDCPITSFVLTNSTGTELTVTTDYVPDLGAGTFTLTNASFPYLFANNVSNATYEYCGTGYLTQGWTRNVLNIVPGFFALALMLVAIALFYSVYAEWKTKD